MKIIKPADVGGQRTMSQSYADFVWRDEKASFIVKNTSGVNNPGWAEYIPGFQGLVFSGSTMNQVWVDFHIDHDIALNTKIYPHVHWMPLTQNAGMVRWGFEYVIAKGHQQSKYPTTSTIVYKEHTFPANTAYTHMVTELDDLSAILSSQIEPDSVVKMRVFRDAANDTYPDKVHAWQSDLHYQIARLGTINKAPNFYGG